MTLLFFLLIIFLIGIAIFYAGLPAQISNKSVNDLARKGNTCEMHKSIKIDDPETGIDYEIQFVNNSCECGLPHTNDEKTIRIPNSYPKHRLQMTIEHEKIHLLQRRFPLLWETWYTKLWQMTLAHNPPVNFPEELLELRRINPDIENKPFACWKNRWWVLAVYKSRIPSSLLEARTCWWDSKNNQILYEPPEGWISFFGSPAQDEHPHEMAAQMLANYTGSSDRIKELRILYQSHFTGHTKNPKKE
jgi:hypothetical protein